MSELRILSEEELKKYGTTWSWSARAKALINQQKATWETAASHYRSLRQVESRWVDFGHFRICLQHNPGRIRSSAADTGAAAVAARPCFLCAGNRPAEQYGLPWGEGYTILANPFPIFHYHLTIPFGEHTPQRLEGRIGDMLRLTRELREFTLFYNGPRCGASAPDHFHFQAGIRDTLPIEEEVDSLLRDHTQRLGDDGTTQVAAVENTLRRFLLFRSANADHLERLLTRTIGILPHHDEEEPMMNLLVWFHENRWTLLLFPRAGQRPWQYFAEGEEKIMVSPAAVELGGLVILPRKEDFLKITDDDLRSVFSQVTLSAEAFASVREQLTTFCVP